MLIYGHNPLLYYLKYYPDDVVTIYVTKNRKVDIENEALFKLGIPVKKVEYNFFERKLSSTNHQGFAAEVKGFMYSNIQDLNTEDDSLLVILDGVQDPANLGAILRTAEGFGVDGVIIPKDRSAEVTPAVMRASSGAARGVNVFRVVNIARAIELLKKKGFWIAAVDMDESAAPYYDHDMIGATVLLFGGEGRGVRRLSREKCDFAVRIPMTGKVESLNVSVSVAIMLSEVARQRRTKRD